MFLENALERRLIFVTGKGGVGKSTISAALAKLTSSLRKRTALIELSTDSALYRHFSLPPSQDLIEDISPHLCVHKIRAKNILQEFITDKFHFKGIYHAFFDNRFVNYFLNATPGFNEFLIMGKLQHLAEHDLTPYDIVIVDAPATGHALALLEVPHIVTQAIHSGPLKHLAAKSLELITDQDKTGLIIVSTPEEMPATEAAIIKDGTQMLDMGTLGLILNKTSPSFAKDFDKKVVPPKCIPVIQNFLNDARVIAKNEKVHINSLKKIFGKDTLKVPIIKEFDEATISNQIFRHLKESYGQKRK